MVRERGPNFAPRGYRVLLLCDPSGLFPANCWFTVHSFAATARAGNLPDVCEFNYYDHHRHLCHHCQVVDGRVIDLDGGQKMYITKTLKIVWR